MNDLSTLYTQSTAGIWMIISAVLALIGAIAAAVYFLKPQGRSRYSGWMQKLNSHINFERYIIPGILKFLYVFSVLYAVFIGIVTMFTGGLASGIVMIVLGPIAMRVGYELIMMLFSIHDKIADTNRLLQSFQQPRPAPPRSGFTGPYPPQPDGTGRREESRPEQPVHYPGGYDPMRR